MIYLSIIEIINNCNLRCKHCYNKFDNDQTISLENFEKISDKLSQYGCSTIRISGGEPTLLGDTLFEYAQISLNYVEHIEITTNGTIQSLISDSRWSIFSNIQISLDGTENIHDKIRGRNTYKKAFDSIIKLKSLGNNVSVMMTVGRYNLYVVGELYQILQKNGVPLYIERITGTGRANPNEELTIDEVKYLFDMIHSFNIKTTDPLYVFYDDEKRGYLYNNSVIGGCSAGFTAICIDSNLNVFPCPRLRINCGNLKESELSEILQSEVIVSLRDRDQLKGKCGKCSERWICGGCRASAFTVDQNYLSEDIGCFIDV